MPNYGLTTYDFGCGSKTFEVYVTENHYIGIHIDSANKDADIFSSIDNMLVDSSVADIVCSFYVLEHVYNPLDVIKEKYRLLKPNKGILFMLVPLYWEEHEQPYDYWRFTQFSLRKMLQDAGFSDIKIEPINAYWSVIGLI